MLALELRGVFIVHDEVFVLLVLVVLLEILELCLIHVPLLLVVIHSGYFLGGGEVPLLWHRPQVLLVQVFLSV